MRNCKQKAEKSRKRQSLIVLQETSKVTEVSKMPNWYWEKKELRTTPSQEKGLDFDTETRYRREGVR